MTRETNFLSKQARRMAAEDFSRSAKLYEMYQVPIHAQVARRLVQLASLKPGQRVLDIGTGTGVAAFTAARKVGESGSVIGIDIAKGMLAIARRKAARLKLANVHFKQMNAASLQLAGQSFDAVICNLATPRPISEFPLVLSEVFRVLKRGGVLCFSEWMKTSRTWKIASRVLSSNMVTNPKSPLMIRRRLMIMINEAGKRFALSGLTGLVRETGFKNVQVISENFRVVYPSARGYLEFFMSREWPEYVAMSHKSRKRFKLEALAALKALETSHGLIESRPVKFWLAVKGRI